MSSSFHQDQCPLTPDARKKKSALPFLLSNLRNAQAVIGRGRAADDLQERDIRPLVRGGGGSSISLSDGVGVGSDRSKMKRSHVPPAPGASSNTHRPSMQRSAASLTATLQNYSMRFGSQWRKRNRKDASGKTYRVSVPQSFLISVGCLFIGFPILFLFYMLARQAVFGDEGKSGSIGHKYEVPSIANEILSGGKDLSESETIKHVEGEMGDLLVNGISESAGDSELTVQTQTVEDSSALFDASLNTLPQNKTGEIGINQIANDSSGKSDVLRDTISDNNKEVIAEDETINTNSVFVEDLVNPDGIMAPHEGSDSFQKNTVTNLESEASNVYENSGSEHILENTQDLGNENFDTTANENEISIAKQTGVSAKTLHEDSDNGHHNNLRG